MNLNELFAFAIDWFLELIALAIDEIGAPAQFGVLIYVIRAIIFVLQFIKKSSK